MNRLPFAPPRFNIWRRCSELAEVGVDKRGVEREAKWGRSPGVEAWVPKGESRGGNRMCSEDERGRGDTDRG